MFSPWSIQEQIIDYKICSFITRFYYQYTSSSQSDALSVGVASQSLGSLSWLLGLTKAFFSNPCSYPSCVNVPWNYLRTLLAKTSQGSPQKSWKTLSVNKSKWCCRSEPHLMRLMRRRCAQGGWTRLRRCEKTLWGRGPSGAATDCWWTKCIPVRARAAEEERCELPDDIFGEWMPLLICEKRHVWANKWRTVTTAWLCTPAPGWCRHRCLLQPGGRCLGSGLLLLPPTGAPRLMQRLTVPEPGRTAEETVRPRVLPTGDSSAGLPCVGLGRNESGLKKMTKQKKLKVKNIRASEKRIMYIFSEVLIETWQKLAETISSKFHKIPLRKNGCK